MKNCPKEYYNNCQNAMLKCRVCLAGMSTLGKLHYVPVLECAEELLQHPYKKDEKKQKRLKQAKYVEEQVKQDIAKGTLRSGAALGDGDIHLLKGEMRVEVKDRGSRSSWNLTYPEYEKGKKQGIDIYAISVDCPDQKRRTVYMMDEDLFTSLMAEIKESRGG